MAVHFFTAGSESGELHDLENRIRGRVPSLIRLTKLEDVTKQIAQQSKEPIAETNFIIFPVLTAPASFDRMVSIAEQTTPGIFFIFLSKEISATDYKRLVRSGGADWASLQDAPSEIADILFRVSNSTRGPIVQEGGKASIIAFVPSAGGVGNTTLALETAVQLKADKGTRSLRVCLLDLDLQASHVCDYLDIEPRLQLGEIANNPDRLDQHLFELFVSRHSSGVDVVASPRNRRDAIQPTVSALDALFAMIAPRYDVLIVDFPPQWSAWTRQILSVSDVAVITGLNTVPGLRQIADCLGAVRSVDTIPPKIVVAVNRCEGRLLGGIARSQHVTRLLGSEAVISIREDSAAAVQALNTGVPIGIASPSNKIVKDIRPIAKLVASAAQKVPVAS